MANNNNIYYLNKIKNAKNKINTAGYLYIFNKYFTAI